MAASIRRFLNTVQGQLFSMAGLFIFLIAVSLTLSPAVELRSWNANFLLAHWVGVLGWVLSFGGILYFLGKYKINPDPILIPVISLLTGWGLLNIFSISQRMGLKQTLWLVLGSAALIIGLPHARKVIANLRKYKYLWLIGGIGLTALTLLLGTNPNGGGPRLWLSLAGVYFQPSEPLKILLILYLAAYFADRQPFAKGLLPLLLPTVIVTGLACLILVFQRDLGTASILIMIYASMIYAATGKKRLLVVSLLGIVLAAIIGYFYFDVVQLRFDAWINPWLDPFGGSYQIVQSLIAIASGGMTGRGPGMGYPDLVPISFSDFIFSAIGEEYGLPGTIGLVIALALFTFRSIRIGLKALNRHLRFVAVGIAVFIAAQSILIISGNIRLLPLTGVTLPFLSYGGSSLLTSLFAVYLLITIDQLGSQPPETTVQELPDPAPVIHLSMILTVGFIAIALINSWWALWRGPDLLGRTDNARRTISDTIIQRGSILDRSGNLLSYSTGSAGDYTRQYASPATTHPVGYTHPFYGQV
ncbi:MAG: FtsW/RodA/SpoVE family cell cycle protein, partial [Anaerolineales bacterium]